jgi:hypothetical protein
MNVQKDQGRERNIDDEAIQRRVRIFRHASAALEDNAQAETKNQEGDVLH